MIDEKKQIEKMADIIFEQSPIPSVWRSEAVKFAEALYKAGCRKQSEWVSVEDRLPEPETDVIAFVGDYIDILSYRYDRRGSLAFMYKDDSGWWHERIRPSVTHWMPLPEPPKMKGGAE